VVGYTIEEPHVFILAPLCIHKVHKEPQIPYTTKHRRPQTPLHPIPNPCPCIALNNTKRYCPISCPESDPRADCRVPSNKTRYHGLEPFASFLQRLESILSRAGERHGPISVTSRRASRASSGSGFGPSSPGHARVASWDRTSDPAAPLRALTASAVGRRKTRYAIRCI
jgi:hypothetical protein